MKMKPTAVIHAVVEEEEGEVSTTTRITAVYLGETEECEAVGLVWMICGEVLANHPGERVLLMLVAKSQDVWYVNRFFTGREAAPTLMINDQQRTLPNHRYSVVL